MKFAVLFTAWCTLCAAPLFSQNWSTFGGNSARNGLTQSAGPASFDAPVWTVAAAPTTLGNAVYTFGDRFVTSRVTFSPYQGRIECRNLQTGALEWTSPFLSNTSILYATGFTQDAVYAHDYNTDSIYALVPQTGKIKWRAPIKSHTFGAYPGFVFACNGDPILNGPITQGIFTMRLDKHTGAVLWTNTTLIAIGPSAVLAAGNGRVYRLTGGITVPILLTAIDAETGQSLYNSAPLPGDPDQENPITLGPNGDVYFWRDGGNLFAFKDNGSAFEPLWSYAPENINSSSLAGNISLDHDGNLYVFCDERVKRISRLDGTVLDSSFVFDVSQPSLTVDGDGTVLVNSGLGAFYAFSADLQTVFWDYIAPSSVYCNLAPSKDGMLVLTQGGTQIRGFRSDQNRAPVADFFAEKTRIEAGQPLAFFDQSSYQPDAWNWVFEGGSPAASSDANPVVTYDVPGVYDVVLVVENALGTDTVFRPCFVEVVPGSSSVTGAETTPVQVFPNPATDVVRVVLPEYREDLTCYLTDATGRQVAQRTVSGSAFDLGLGDLPPGLYCLVLVGGKGVQTATVIKTAP